MTNRALSHLLEELGLNKSERSILQILLQQQPLTAGVLAKRTSLKRPTVYAALQSLIQRGVVSEYQSEAVTRYATISPELIANVLTERERQKVQRMQEAGGAATPLLQALASSGQLSLSGFKVRSLTSVESVYLILEKALTQGSFRSIFNPQLSLVSAAVPVVKRFLKKTSITKPTIRELAVAGPKSDWYVRAIKNPHHLVRMLPRETVIISDIILFSGNVLITNYTEQSAQSVLIEEESLFNTMGGIFEALWGVGLSSAGE